jgi:hypothetical protein
MEISREDRCQSSIGLHLLTVKYQG